MLLALAGLAATMPDNARSPRLTIREKALLSIPEPSFNIYNAGVYGLQDCGYNFLGG